MDVSLLQVMSKNQIQTLLRGIQGAFDEHVRWACRCQNTLLADGVVDESLLEKDSHLHCNFGRWIHGGLPGGLSASKDFKMLSELHRRFHDAARTATLARIQGRVLSVEDCENLLTAQSDLLIALNQYLREVAEGDSLFDPLTGLLNRQEMYRLLEKEKSRSERTGLPTMIAMADLDFFKSVNDRFGHEAGDCVLRETASRFSSKLRSYDLLFRVGGEEFLFCFPATDAEEARNICDRIREAVEQGAVEVGGGRTVSVTVSFGIAPLMSDRPVSDSMRLADDALYEAKGLGRNMVRMAAP